MGTNNHAEFFDEKRRNSFLQDFFTRIEKIQADSLIVVSIFPQSYQQSEKP